MILTCIVRRCNKDKYGLHPSNVAITPYEYVAQNIFYIKLKYFYIPFIILFYPFLLSVSVSMQ